MVPPIPVVFPPFITATYFCIVFFGVMVLTTRADFTKLNECYDDAASFISAFANGTRLLILSKLSQNEMSVGALAEHVNVSQSALSQHLTKLRLLDLVTTRRDAQTIYYRTASPLIEPILETLSTLYLDIEAK